ncbi:oxidoreductase [Haloferax namakaokahaiae]|uniref:Oxidoreductase n=1 Tax=Haloferax namakaokahaiae TaxID=1748331 RepID=A0ABD5ZEG8_9EURY
MTDHLELSDHVSVIAGGAGLIGSEVSRGLAECGANVVIADPSENGSDLADELGNHVHHVPTDVTDPESVDSLFEGVISEYGRIDSLVNTAYPRNEQYGVKFEEVTFEDWNENLSLHLGSYFYTSKCAAIQMQSQSEGGSIVNFGSIYGIEAPDFTIYDGTTMTSPVEYSAIKAGIINFSRYLASYFGPNGVRANTVSPGGVFNNQNDNFVKRYEKQTPIRRMATPEDLVGPVLFLVSDASRYVTGHNLVVDGGWTIS